jgi:hypothetical protein
MKLNLMHTNDNNPNHGEPWHVSGPVSEQDPDQSVYVAHEEQMGWHVMRLTVGSIEERMTNAIMLSRVLNAVGAVYETPAPDTTKC